VKIRLNLKAVLGVLATIGTVAVCLKGGGNVLDCLKGVVSTAGLTGLGVGVAVSGTHEATKDKAAQDRAGGVT